MAARPRVRPADPRPGPLGGGFAGDGNHAVLSWMAADGRLFTRVGTDTEGRYGGYVWRHDGTGSTLVADSLGIVCLDLYATPVRYGTC